MERKLKHLEMIQGVINRLSSNSFLLKGWSVVVVSAFFALSAPTQQTHVISLAFIPVLIFWGLDGYFLWKERQFRDLYDKVRQQDKEAIDFSMDAKSVSSKKLLGASFSPTIIIFHGVLVGAIVFVMTIYN